MPMSIRIDIVSTEAEIYSGTANMVYIPAIMGEIGVAPRHTPLLTTLKAGEVRVQIEGQDEQFFYVSGGLVEVQPHIITVLADTALRAKDIDEVAAQEAKARAEKAMEDNSSEFEFAKAKAQLAEAIAQLRAVKKIKKLR
jgi:F-type H+-transporting ATPase subunit epsilon